MPISHERKIIFVHIPKTGGTSIESALGMHAAKEDIGLVPYKWQYIDYHHLYGKDMQHMTLEGIRSYLSKIHFNDYRNFGWFKHIVDSARAIFSNGDSSIGSEIFNSYTKFAVVRNPYARLVSHFSWQDGKWHKQVEPDKSDFKEFVDAIISKKLHKTDSHLIPQIDFVCINGEIKTDKILRLEHLDSDFSELCDDMGINVELSKRMVSKHSDYREYYDDEVVDKVYDLYKDDFAAFNYKKSLLEL